MSKLNYFYSCCCLGIWVLCRAGLCQQSLPSYSMWILLLLGWLGPAGKSDPDQIKAAPSQKVEWGCFSSRKILLVRFSRTSCVFHSSVNAGPVQPNHAHTPVPSVVHNPKCGQTLVQEQCLDRTASWRPVYSGRSKGDFNSLLPSVFLWCSICFCHMWNVHIKQRPTTAPVKVQCGGARGKSGGQSIFSISNRKIQRHHWAPAAAKQWLWTFQ